MSIFVVDGRQIFMIIFLYDVPVITHGDGQIDGSAGEDPRDHEDSTSKRILIQINSAKDKKLFDNLRKQFNYFIIIFNTFFFNLLRCPNLLIIIT